MLKSIDVLLGLTVIMLALSMAVTVITQFAVAVANSRGRHLRRGLTDLLGLLDPSLRGPTGRAVASAVLTHPLVSGATSRFGTVVHREEFVKLLLELADPNSPQPLEGTARAALVRTLSENGVADPATTLRNVRALALQLESSNPEFAADTRNSIALLQEARSDLLAKVNTWFDQTMDRTSQRFTASTRALTFAASVLLVTVLQVDTVTLVNRLAADEALRAQFVASATAQPAALAPPAPATWDGFVNTHGLIMVPRSLSDWSARWRVVNAGGLAITVLLLSLGAPFWYSALGRLIQLRSLVAANDDAQRAARQRAQASGPAGGGALAAVAVSGASAMGAGERGDLRAF